MSDLSEPSSTAFDVRMNFFETMPVELGDISRDCNARRSTSILKDEKVEPLLGKLVIGKKDGFYMVIPITRVNGCQQVGLRKNITLPLEEII